MGGEARWDRLVLELRKRRDDVGQPSFAELANRIVAARRDRGLDHHAAHVGRSTVYDVFQLGRSRLNFDLVREVGAALDVDTETVDEWIAACSSPASSDEDVIESAEWTLGFIAAVLFGSLVLNLLGREFVDLLHLPIYLDMVGTAIAAIALGPWYGALVGVATNSVGAIGSGMESFPFAAVNVAGALLWGYGVRRFGWGRTLPRFFVLNVAVALACSIIAVPILVLVFGGSVGQGQDTITDTFLELGTGLATAVGASNLMTSTADKLLSGFVALVVITALPYRRRRGLPLTLADQRPDLSGID